jgi:hypothetical protein
MDLGARPQFHLLETGPRRLDRRPLNLPGGKPRAQSMEPDLATAVLADGHGGDGGTPNPKLLEDLSLKQS